MATWLLYNKSWPDLIPGASRIEAHWPIDRGDYRIKSEECPELSVAHAEHAIRSMYQQAGLTIVEPIRLDASYCPSRIPEQRSLGMHLYYAVCVFAIRP